jgi:hypothetical protein
MKAIALVTQSVIQSRIKPWMEAACARRGVELTFRNVTESTKDYTALFKAHRNIITWNCRMPHNWMRKWGGNILFVENSLLCQRAGIFIDSGGFFSRSNLCRLRTWEQEYAVDLDAFTRKNFQWGAMAGGDGYGPVLVCLQSGKDSNMIQQFPLGDGADDRLERTLDILREHLPRGRRVVIRPNPRFLDEWNAKERVLRDDWTVSYAGNFHSILPDFSALVSVNSTCVSEAITLGMPVATLGIGAFTGSGATMDCSRDPATLQNLPEWYPDGQRCERYAKAVLGRHFMPYDVADDANSVEFDLWLNACR